MEQATTTLLENRQERVYRDLEQVWDHLRGLVLEAEAEHWLYAPNPTLEGASPRDLIEQGETERVLELVATVEHGIYS